MELTGDGFVGLTIKAVPYGGLDLGGIHETITTDSLPLPVLTAASSFSNPSLRLDRTSLRLQNAWGYGLGVYILRGLQLGGRYNQDSWRYDWLGFPAKTSIPYLKGTQWNTVGFARYDRDFRRFHATLDGGAGYARVDFHQGVEQFLGDHDTGLLARVSGTTFPLSLGLGYNLLNPKESDERLIPFARYDYAWTNLTGGTRVHKRQFVFGILFFMAR